LAQCAEGPDRFDVVIHCAAVRHRHRVPESEYGRVNVALTRQVIDIVRRRGGRLVDVSSIAVYGWPRELPIDETRPYAPVGPYGASKVETERMVRGSGVPFTIVQPSITYGPGDTNGMIDKMFRMIARGRFVVPGLGTARVKLVFVEDLARLVVAAAARESTLGEAFICTHRDPVRVGDLVQRMASIVHRWIPAIGPPTGLLRLAALPFELADALRLLGGEPPLTREKLATISVDRAYRIDKMRRLLGSEPETSLEDGLRRTAEALGIA
ncbi:MAG: NAD-dependent epimerase/dehydratase family protein, partial [Polyangiaceae bacterium]